MAITLPRNALIKLTGLNTSAQRNLKRITGYSASGGYVTFYTPSTSGLVNDSTVVISNMSGAPSATWSFTVNSVTATSFRTPSNTYLSWPVSVIRTYRNDTLRYLDAIIYGTMTIKPQDTVALACGSSFPTSDLTVAITSNSDIIFTQNGSDFSGGASYPLYSAGPVWTSPTNGTATLKATAAGVNGGVRTPGLNNVYWAVGGGPSTLTLSDHSRSPLKATPEDISKGGRTVDATMRKSHIASKQTFSTDWDLLPADAVATVDGYAGGKDLLDFYNNNVSSFTMELYNRDAARKGSSPDSVYTVMIKDFDYEIVKRNIQSPDGRLTDYWNVSLALEEV